MPADPLAITRTSQRKPPRIMVAGPAKVGKSTFAASMPAPIFIRSEDGTNGMDVDAFPVLQSFDDCMAQLRHLAKPGHGYQTVVIDALDGLERVIWHAVVADYNATSSKRQVESIESIEYAKGFVFALAYWERVLKALTYLRDQGMLICLLAHTHQRRVTPPDLPEYERYEPRLHHKALAMIVEWLDLIGFARMETRTKEVDGRTQGVTTGRRMLYCSESAAYVAGNRYGIENPLELSWPALSQAIGN